MATERKATIDLVVKTGIADAMVAHARIVDGVVKAVDFSHPGAENQKIEPTRLRDAIKALTELERQIEHELNPVSAAPICDRCHGPS